MVQNGRGHENEVQETMKGKSSVPFVKEKYEYMRKEACFLNKQ